MGRVKSKFPTGNIVIKNKKPNKEGKVALYLCYNINTTPVTITTDIFVKPDDWDSKTQTVKSKNPAAVRLNNQLKLQREKVDEQIMAYEGHLTADIVRKMLKGEFAQQNDPKKIDFIQYATEYNQQRYDLEKLSYSTYYNGDRYIKKFQRFLSEQTGEGIIYLTDLTIDLIEKYKTYCIKRGNTKEGINKMLTPLIKAAMYATDNDLLSAKVSAQIKQSYFDLKERQYRSEVEDSEVRYLTEEQMQQFVDLYSKVKFNRTREIMDMFLFAFHACGLRVSDIVTLEWSHIDWEQHELSKNLVKGKVPHTIPLTDAAMDILKRWQEKNLNKRFVFSLLDSTFDTSDAALLDKKIKSKNRILQTSLNEVGNKIGLPFNLTMHLARH
ncbi:putative uncharacterized protein [Alistipes sp. CAG:268]|jgi:integrase|uniref:site-specific integrase n=1 Tax=Alistipes sp. CAG:268 TaxID=1262693 RepID=UPI000339AD36|nr:site-specific integrase [Alistipes sp. CAG:268]CDC96384.1 putative uncharacterized protein [Alistipes sp. CAG:268]